MVDAVNRLNGIAEDVAERHENSGLVHYVDAASSIPADSATLVDKSHLTAEGSELLGRLIAFEIFGDLSRSRGGM